MPEKHQQRNRYLWELRVIWVEPLGFVAWDEWTSPVTFSTSTYFLPSWTMLTSQNSGALFFTYSDLAILVLNILNNITTTNQFCHLIAKSTSLLASFRWVFFSCWYSVAWYFPKSELFKTSFKIHASRSPLFFLWVLFFFYALLGFWSTGKTIILIDDLKRQGEKI